MGYTEETRTVYPGKPIPAANPNVPAYLLLSALAGGMKGFTEQRAAQADRGQKNLAAAIPSLAANNQISFDPRSGGQKIDMGGKAAWLTAPQAFDPSTYSGGPLSKSQADIYQSYQAGVSNKPFSFASPESIKAGYAIAKDNPSFSADYQTPGGVLHVGKREDIMGGGDSSGVSMPTEEFNKMIDDTYKQNSSNPPKFTVSSKVDAGNLLKRKGVTRTQWDAIETASNIKEKGKKSTAIQKALSDMRVANPNLSQQEALAIYEKLMED